FSFSWKELLVSSSHSPRRGVAAGLHHPGSTPGSRPRPRPSLALVTLDPPGSKGDPALLGHFINLSMCIYRCHLNIHHMDGRTAHNGAPRRSTAYQPLQVLDPVGQFRVA